MLAELGNFLRKLSLGKGCIVYLNKHKNENVGSGASEGPISYQSNPGFFCKNSKQGKELANKVKEDLHLKLN